MVGRPPSSTEQSEPLSEGKATLLELLLAKRPRSEPLIERHPRGRIGESNRFPASLAQQSIWFIDRFDGGGAAYNIPIAVELRGALNRDALQWALDELVCRHEPLRTLFRDTDGSSEQEIQENQAFVLPVLDLTESSDEERMAEVERQKAEEAQARFDLSSGPLIRGRLLCLRPLEHVLLLTMHHIVSDGWSIDILMRELGALYDAYKNGPANSLPALPIQYADFALWQRQWLTGNAALNQLSYWRSRLQGATSALELPTDRPRPAVRRFRGRSVELALDDALSDRLKALSRRHGMTVFMLMCGAWAVLMSRLTGQDDLSIGTPVANRRRDALEDLVGLFVNTLVLRFSLKSGMSLSEFFAHVKEVTLGAFDHQEVPFEQLVEVIRPQRPAGEHPMFQTMFTFRTVQVRQWSVGGLTATLHEIDNRASKFDLLLSMEERGGRLTGNVQYDEDLFDRGTVMRWLGCFTALLRGMVSREKCCLGDLPILQERERHAVVHLFNETG